MRVFQFINDINVRNGGAQRVVRILHRHLRKEGIDSSIVSLQPNVEEEVAEFHSLDLKSVYSLSAIQRIRKFIKQNCGKQDVIHAHLFPTNLWVSLACRLSGFKGQLVCTEHSTSNRRRGTWKGRLIDRMTYGLYKKIICISQGTQDSLCRWMPALSGKTNVIENGTDLIFDAMPQRTASDGRVVLSAGRLSEPKNYENALEAIALLKDLRFEYRIAGVGPLEQDLKQQASELGISDKVRFLGFVSDLKKLYLEADLFLIPSRWEGFGLSAVEAMNSGLPVIASDVEGLNDVVDTTCGLLVDPNDPQSIADAIRQLVEDAETGKSLGKKGYDRSFQFSGEHMARRYADVYQNERLGS